MIALHAAPQLELAENLRRLLARQGMSIVELADLSGLDLRTLRGILAGRKRPHSRTLHRLANALSVSADELFQDPSLLVHRSFDRQTNPVVADILREHADLVRGWGESDFDELYSRFGTGGALTAEGTVETIRSMNHVRRVQNQVAVLLETAEAELLSQFVEMLYRRVVVVDEQGELLAPAGKLPDLPGAAEIREKPQRVDDPTLDFYSEHSH
ncbi:MAG: helix-turn-helix transcriptional regulator [Planctomycetota bacterium]|nr:helix-turn-helix transcriptional regulator [Planctomycetota bacterium]